MSEEEISSVIRCWETMLKISSPAHPLENSRPDEWPIGPENLASILLQNTNSKTHAKQKIPFTTSPQSLRFLFGYGGFNPAINQQASQKSLRKDLPMVINGVPVVARHDSCAGGNFMSEKLACLLNLGLHQDPSDTKLFTLGNSKTVKSIGTVYTSCQFARDSSASFDCCFNVLTKLSTSLIMGISFLEESQTLSRNRHRLQDRTNLVGKLPTVNLLESTKRVPSKKFFVCNIDNRKTLTNPDSASDLDLVSPEYAMKYGYELMGPGTQVQLADTSVALTSGKILATLGLDDGRVLLIFFDVLPGLDSDVLLGEDTLERIKAFTTLSKSFIDVAVDHKTLPELKIILDRKFIERLFTRSGDRKDVAPTELPFSSPKRTHMREVYAKIFHEDSHAEDDSTNHSPIQNCLSQEGKASKSAARHTKPSEVLVLGGNPFTSTKAFFTATATTLTQQLHRIPDGESYLLPLAKIMKSQEQGASTADRGVRSFTLNDVKPLGYDDRAIASYETFRSLKDAGIIPPSVRFQILLPSPLSMVTLSVQNDEVRAQIEKLYETQLHQTLHLIQRGIPASDLAIQWDLLAEVAVFEWERNQDGRSNERHSSSKEAEVFDPLIRLASAVDPAVEMGFRLCFGNSEHIRFEPPADIASLFGVAIQVANSLVQNIEQSHHVEYIHIPVPKEKVDEEYFKIMGDLALGDTQLFLGVVYAGDEAGTRKRLEAVQAVYPNIAGVGIESGMDRMSQEDFGDVLEICASLTS